MTPHSAPSTIVRSGRLDESGRGRGQEARRAAHGFTLLEVLIVAAILGLVMAALGRTLALGRTTSVVLESTAEQRQIRSLVEELLRYDLVAAGFVPPQLQPLAEAMVDPLVIRRHPSRATGDEILVRYLDDQGVETPKARDFAFSAGVDGRGEAQLYRREGGGSRQPLVAGLSSLRLLAIAREGRWQPARTRPGDDAAAGELATPSDAGSEGEGDAVGGAGAPRVEGLRLELAFAWGERAELVVALPNRPPLKVEEEP